MSGGIHSGKSQRLQAAYLSASFSWRFYRQMNNVLYVIAGPSCRKILNHYIFLKKSHRFQFRKEVASIDRLLQNGRKFKILKTIHPF